MERFSPLHHRRLAPLRKGLFSGSGEGGKAVDALLVFPGAVFADFVWALFVRPFVEDVALAFEVEEGDGVAA